MKQVAIQGFYGSFHDIAAHIYFGEDVLTVPCDTFKESIDWVVNHENGVVLFLTKINKIYAYYE